MLILTLSRVKFLCLSSNFDHELIETPMDKQHHREKIMTFLLVKNCRKESIFIIYLNGMEHKIINAKISMD